MVPGVFSTEEDKVRQLPIQTEPTTSDNDVLIKCSIATQTDHRGSNLSSCNTDTSPELDLNGLTPDLSNVNTPNSNCSLNYSKSQFSQHDLTNPTSTFIIGGATTKDNDNVLI